MVFQVEVTVRQPLDEKTRRFLEAARLSANRIIRFTGDGRFIKLTVEAAGLTHDEALRSAAGEVARILPASKPEFEEPRRG
jgi:hypothetical protein